MWGPWSLRTLCEVQGTSYLSGFRRNCLKQTSSPALQEPKKKKKKEKENKWCQPLPPHKLQQGHLQMENDSSIQAPKSCQLCLELSPSSLQCWPTGTSHVWVDMQPCGVGSQSAQLVSSGFWVCSTSSMVSATGKGQSSGVISSQGACCWQMEM